MPEFDKKKSHEENVQISIDKILGSNTVLKRAKKTTEDHRKNLFIGIIEELAALDFRDQELDRSFYLDLSKYNSPFYSIINSLFHLTFNKEQVNLIFFYLYERITPEGYILDVTDESGRVLDLTSAEKLFEEVNKLK